MLRYHKREMEKAEIEDYFDLRDLGEKDNNIKATTAKN